ncbi:hypothetical protein BN59_03447 [Legionella massiliensis]|uniref:Uncharacterized protein n=1 Tax=Legionella massiliensis TaxID=1034943 RepID=A0A078KXJ0_9GAMM|nr:hypothetical protein [Legionella massiliensis]CDZ79130.1 hypothetical protein BN59_03447 [Legionella massiliensis]CEE14868.1 hypothetical protein BN1094_03447 [Legionella massiliensis]
MDPLGELEDSLAYMFELQKTQSQGKYINPLIDELHKALDNYREDTGDLSDLIDALSNAYPVIENYVDTYEVKQKMDVLAGNKGESISWYTQSRPSNAPAIDYASLVSEGDNDFVSWLSQRVGQNFTKLDGERQVQILLTEQGQKELRVKLGVHLHRNPDFLLNLAMISTKNFIRLISSRLGFKFEKKQIAKAIHHHGKSWLDDSLDPFEQVEKLIAFLDKKLSPKGHTIEKLLNDPIAKAELEKSLFIQFYNSPEFKNREDDGDNQLKMG